MARLVIVPKFTPADIKRALATQKVQIETAIINRLQRIGEEFVRNAREKGTYQDQTGNLRNSIGYVILKDGEQLFENFRKSAKVKQVITRGKNKGKEKITYGSGEGLNRAKEVIEKAKAKHPKGFVLIVVAGMEYAWGVESGHRKKRNGEKYSVPAKDVLSSSSLIAEQQLKEAIVKISKKIK